MKFEVWLPELNHDSFSHTDDWMVNSYSANTMKSEVRNMKLVCMPSQQAFYKSQMNLKAKTLKFIFTCVYVSFQ